MLKFYIPQPKLFSPLIQLATAITLFLSLHQLGYNLSIINTSFFGNKSFMHLNELSEIEQKYLNTS